MTELLDATALGRSTGFDVTRPDPAALDADAVIVTAGVLTNAPLMDTDDADIDAMISTNVTGAIRVARAAYPYLSKRRGHLLFTTSSAFTRGRAGLATYSATKAAVVALTQALADEWDDVRVNCIAPERCATPMRTNGFGAEDPDTLLDPHDAARQIADILGTPLTGQVFDVRKSNGDQ